MEIRDRFHKSADAREGRYPKIGRRRRSRRFITPASSVCNHLKEMDKDATITELLSWLRRRLGDKFVLTGHWDADLCAVGISARNDPAQLVYILSWGRPAEHCGVETESVPLPGSDAPYQTVGGFQAVTREELQRIIEDHLRLSD